MTRTTRHAALAALATVAAIIAADFTQLASAQSDDGTAGRIVARRLDDGRVEFGWQPTGGERVLPRQRYFPPDARVDRWLRSSPIEVGGAAIGRINARMLENGRIEFAFTPTDGERILTRSRYFPADARVGRWLHSTEITIGPPAAGRFTAVAVGWGYTCAIRANSGEIACWGVDGWGEWVEYDAPAGSFIAVSAGDSHACAIHDTGKLECWGSDLNGRTDAPLGAFTAVSAGRAHTCAIRSDGGAIECWGLNGIYISATGEEWHLYETGQTDPPEGSYTAVSAGDLHTCAIRASDGAIECWGDNDRYGQSDAPEGSYTAVSAGETRTCAIHDAGNVECWGNDHNGQTDAPLGTFTAVSGGYAHTCAIRESGMIACWGLNGYYGADDTGEWQLIETGQTDALTGNYTAVSAGARHTCAIRESGAISCWGKNAVAQATPPS